MIIPHIFIKKGAVLKGVNLVGLNVVFEMDRLPEGADNDDAMARAIEKTVDELEDVCITHSMRSTPLMYAYALTQRVIDKARIGAQKGQT